MPHERIDKMIRHRRLAAEPRLFSSPANRPRVIFHFMDGQLHTRPCPTRAVYDVLDHTPRGRGDRRARLACGTTVHWGTY